MEPSRELIDELWREEIEFARQMSPIDRMTAAGELFDEVCERMRAGIRHEFPDADEERVRGILFERFEMRGGWRIHLKANEAVVAVIDALDAQSVPYMLAGGYAVNFYGVARSTKDADFVAQFSGDPMPELAKRLGPEFRLDPQMRFESVTGTYRYIFSLASIPFKIEVFMLSDDPHDQERFGRRVQLRWLERDVFLPTFEDLLVTKLRWSRQGNRAKDIEDVQNMVAVRRDKIDWPYVERRCDEHGTRELLAQVRRDAEHRLSERA